MYIYIFIEHSIYDLYWFYKSTLLQPTLASKQLEFIVQLNDFNKLALRWNYSNIELYKYSPLMISVEKLQLCLLNLKDFYSSVNPSLVDPRVFYKIKLILINIDCVVDDLKTFQTWVNSYGFLFNQIVDRTLKINQKWKFIEDKCNVIVSFF